MRTEKMKLSEENYLRVLAREALVDLKTPRRLRKEELKRIREEAWRELMKEAS